MPISYRPRAPSFSSDTETETEPTPPAPTDADDSIVLSDLVRTGEASRLRRRGAMRLDHGHAGQPIPQRASSPATVVVVGSPPPWDSEPEDRDGTGPEFAWSDRERNSRFSWGPPREIRRGVDDDGEEFRHTLFCGGYSSEAEYEVDDRSWAPYEPSPLPSYPSTSTAPGTLSHSSHTRRRSRKSNGCGSVIHMHASPRQRLGVWTAKSEASDAVVGMEPMYFDRSAVAKIVRSACGCIREGVGCGVCGNPLGTRYKPCKTAGDGIFSARSKPPGYLYPEGPRYWHAHTHSPSTRPSNPNFYVYTFFSAAVSSSPSYDFPARPSPLSRYSEIAASQPRQPQTLVPTPRSQEPELPQSEVADNSTPTASTLIFDRVLTASPTTFEQSGGREDREPYRSSISGFLQAPFQGVNANGVPVDFDPDGEFITEPNSPDKTNEVMLYLER